MSPGASPRSANDIVRRILCFSARPAARERRRGGQLRDAINGKSSLRKGADRKVALSRGAHSSGFEPMRPIPEGRQGETPGTRGQFETLTARGRIAAGASFVA